MIGLYLGDHLLRNIGYLSGAVMAAIHFFNQISYLSGSYAFRVKLDDHVFQHICMLLVVRQRVLMKQAVAVSWHLDFNFAKLRIHLAKVGTVPRIAGIPAVSCIRIIT